MSLWTNSDAANGAPIFPGVAGANTAITGSQMFGNTQIGAFSTGLRETTGIFGVDTTEIICPVPDIHTSIKLEKL